jgi:glycosyltransferase involved in cell wall biosynthesis
MLFESEEKSPLPDLKILAGHPTQYHVPFYQAICADGFEIEVGYYHHGTADQLARDPEFGIDIKWDIDLLSGYPHQFFNQGEATYQWSEQTRIAPRLISWALQDRKTPLLLMGWVTEIVWLIWLLRIFRRAPILVMSETTPLSFGFTPKPAWRVSLLRWLLQHSTANLFIGSRNRAFLQDMGVREEQLFRTPYSVDNARFAMEAKRLMPERNQLCQRHGLDPEKPVFLFCGKLIPKKRPIQLLEAYLAAGLAERAQLLFVGEGVLRQELEHRIQLLDLKHVHLLGFLNQTQMPLAYVLGEVLCLISDPTETWGLVVNEALACRRPVIVSDTIGCSPDLVSSDNGWVTPLDNHEKLTQTLLYAFSHHNHWTKMGELGRNKVAGHTFSAMAGGVVSSLHFVQAIKRRGLL